MILNDNEIRNRVNNPKNYDMEFPLISPFEEKQLQGASYDLVIEDVVYCFKNTSEIVDIRNQESIDRAYGKKYIGDSGLLIMPHAYILTTLKETLFVPKDLTAHLRPKTRFIRLGLFMSGQHINPDSICKLNIGLYNSTPNPIRIFPGISVAQVVFEEMKSIPSDKNLYRSKDGTHYSQDIAFIGARFQNEFDDYVDRQVNNMLDLD